MVHGGHGRTSYKFRIQAQCVSCRSPRVGAVARDLLYHFFSNARNYSKQGASGTRRPAWWGWGVGGIEDGRNGLYGTLNILEQSDCVLADSLTVNFLTPPGFDFWKIAELNPSSSWMHCTYYHTNIM